MEVILEYNDLMASELEVVGSETQTILDFYRNSLKSLPAFDWISGNDVWIMSMKKIIASFKITVEKCLNA